MTAHQLAPSLSNFIQSQRTTNRSSHFNGTESLTTSLNRHTSLLTTSTTPSVYTTAVLNNFASTGYGNGGGGSASILNGQFINNNETISSKCSTNAETCSVLGVIAGIGGQSNNNSNYNNPNMEMLLNGCGSLTIQSDTDSLSSVDTDNVVQQFKGSLRSRKGYRMSSLIGGGSNSLTVPGSSGANAFNTSTTNSSSDNMGMLELKFVKILCFLKEFNMCE